MTQPDYATSMETHKDKMIYAANMAAAEVEAAGLSPIKDVIVGYPAVEMGDMGKVAIVPLLNVYPVASTTVGLENDTRTEEVQWICSVIVKDAPGSTQESYEYALQASRIVAQTLEKIVPDAGGDSDPDATCYRVDIVNSATFRPENATGAMGATTITCTIRSTVPYSPYPQPPSLPAYIQRSKWRDADLSLVVGSEGIVDTATTISSARYTTLTSTDPLPDPLETVEVRIGAAGFIPTNGWAIDNTTRLTAAVSFGPSGMTITIPSTVNLSTGRTYTVMAWNGLLVWHGLINVTVPNP